MCVDMELLSLLSHLICFSHTQYSTVLLKFLQITCAIENNVGITKHQSNADADRYW